MNLSNDSITFPCGLPPDFPPSLEIPVYINYIQSAIALLTGIIGFILNLFVLIIIAKYRSLHQRLMYIAVQIVVMEMAYSLLVPPAIFVSGIVRMWVFGEVMCNILAVVNDAFAWFRFMMTLILTLDRFISVFMPFFYQKNSKAILVCLHILVYATTFIRVVLPLTGILGCYIYVSTNKICTAFSSCSTGCYYFVLISIILIILFGVILPLILYILLFAKAFIIRRRTRIITEGKSNFRMRFNNRRSTVHPLPETTNITTGMLEATGNDPSKTMAPNTPDSPKTKKPEQNRHDTDKKDKTSLRVTKTMFILLLSVIGCTFPAFTLYFIQVATLQKSGAFFILIMLLGRTSFNSIPIFDAIAIMRDKQFKTSSSTFLSEIKSKLRK